MRQLHHGLLLRTPQLRPRISRRRLINPTAIVRRPRTNQIGNKPDSTLELATIHPPKPLIPTEIKHPFGSRPASLFQAPPRKGCAHLQTIATEIDGPTRARHVPRLTL